MAHMFDKQCGFDLNVELQKLLLNAKKSEALKEKRSKY